MSKGFNKVNLLGGLTRDPEVKQGGSGTAYIRFSLACGYYTKDKVTGEFKEQVDYINCTAFGRNAENIGKHCTKGSQLFIDGKIKNSKFEHKGETKYETYVLVEDVYLAGGKRKDEQSQAQPEQRQQYSQNRRNNQQYDPSDSFTMDFDDMPPMGGEDADIPF